MREKDLIYVDLIAACQEPGCPLCRISQAYLDHHLDSVMYEYVLSEMRDELAEFIRKNDYRFRDEKFGVEGDSWIRSIGLLAENCKT